MRVSASFYESILNGRGSEARRRSGSSGSRSGNLSLQDKTSQLPNRKFVALSRQTAREKDIPLQDELIVIYGDDAAEIQSNGRGTDDYGRHPNSIHARP